MEEIIERDHRILKTLIETYKIEYTIEELINLESVFIFVEYYKNENMTKNGKLYRATLYANVKHIVKNGEIIKFEKVKKNIIIYICSKADQKNV